jgi:hypothetical protein
LTRARRNGRRAAASAPTTPPCLGHRWCEPTTTARARLPAPQAARTSSYSSSPTHNSPRPLRGARRPSRRADRCRAARAARGASGARGLRRPDARHLSAAIFSARLSSTETGDSPSARQPARQLGRQLGPTARRGCLSIYLSIYLVERAVDAFELNRDTAELTTTRGQAGCKRPPARQAARQPLPNRRVGWSLGWLAGWLADDKAKSKAALMLDEPSRGRDKSRRRERTGGRRAAAEVQRWRRDWRSDRGGARAGPRVARGEARDTTPERRRSDTSRAAQAQAQASAAQPRDARGSRPTRQDCTEQRPNPPALTTLPRIQWRLRPRKASFLESTSDRVQRDWESARPEGTLTLCPACPVTNNPRLMRRWLPLASIQHWLTLAGIQGKSSTSRMLLGGVSCSSALLLRER